MVNPRSLARLASLATLTTLAIACASEFKIDHGAYCQEPGRQGDRECSNLDGSGGGDSGRGGSENGSAGVMGSGGNGQQGDGGGGTGGAPECDDQSCLGTSGPGSLCIGGACTKTASQCSSSGRRVVVDKAFVGDVASDDLEQGCFYRSLNDAFVSPLGVSRVTVYAQATSFSGTIDVLENLTLEGRSSTRDAGVDLVVAADVGQPSITMHAGAVLKGFNVSGGSPAVRVEGGAARLEAPLSFRSAGTALLVTEGSAAVVKGTPAAPVTFAGNDQGIVVEPGAGLTLQGNDDGAADAGGIIIEGTKAGFGLQVKAGSVGNGVVVVDRVVARNNIKATTFGSDAAIAIEKNRTVEIKDSEFVNNASSITLNGAGVDGPGPFDAVVISGSNFENALQDLSNKDVTFEGVAICGIALDATGTQLKVLPNNTLINGDTCSTPTIVGNCTEGATFGHTAASLAIVCN